MLKRITGSLFVGTMHLLSLDPHRAEPLRINEIKDNKSGSTVALKKALCRRWGCLGDSSQHCHWFAVWLGEVTCLRWAHFLIFRMRVCAGPSSRSLSLCVHSSESSHAFGSLVTSSPIPYRGQAIVVVSISLPCHTHWRAQTPFLFSLFRECKF